MIGPCGLTVGEVRMIFAEFLYSENLINSVLAYISVRFVNNVFRRIVGIPMETNCAPLIVTLFLCCCESHSIAKLKKRSF